MNIFLEYLKYGLSVIPVANKICTIASWKEYQQKRATDTQAAYWAGDIAIICGEVSGGLICIDFDVKNGNKWDEWICLISEQFPELLGKLVIEKTPSGGYHVVFRSDTKIKNVKLAVNIQGACTIETRGEGGYFVCTPSKGYEYYYGSFDKIQKLSPEETEIILSCCRSFNEKIEEKQFATAVVNNILDGNITPFDDYDTKENPLQLLQSKGWSVLFTRNNVVYLKRPGKDTRGISATWNHIPNRLYVFSTSTQFENNHLYKASAVFSLIIHNGNFSEAAMALYANGYGSRMVKKPEPTQEKKTLVVSSSGIKEKLYEVRDIGYPKGKSTGWTNLDGLYSVVKGQLTVVTGMPSHGKSEVVDSMMLNLAMCDNWKFAIFAPENYPVVMHYHKLIEKLVRKPLMGNDATRMQKSDIDLAIKYIDEHFFFIDATEDEINLESVLDEAQRLITDKKIDGLCLDPWNEIELSKPKDLSSTEYIGKCLRICRKFARRNNIHLWIVAHPTKMQKDKDGNYGIPELYDIEGSAHWRNKADNGLCVHRPSDGYADVHVQKIKYRYCGKNGTAKLRYDLQTGVYTDYAGF